MTGPTSTLSFARLTRYTVTFILTLLPPLTSVLLSLSLSLLLSPSQTSTPWVCRWLVHETHAVALSPCSRHRLALTPEGTTPRPPTYYVPSLTASTTSPTRHRRTTSSRTLLLRCAVPVLSACACGASATSTRSPCRLTHGCRGGRIITSAPLTQEHESKFSHELIAGAAAFAAERCVFRELPRQTRISCQSQG